MNCVQLIGRLTSDPVLRYTREENKPVCRFTLAVPRVYTQNVDADYIRVVVFGKQAENVDRYLAKGRKAAVEGRIETGSYKDRDGKTIYTTVVIAARVEFLGGGDKAKEAAPSGENFTPQEAGQSAEQAAYQTEMPIGMPDAFQSVEENIPF